MDTSAPGVADTKRVLERLAERLESRADELARQWHDELRERLRVRPQKVFPTEEILDGAPGVVHWLARSVRNGDDLGAENTESLREMAAYWRRAGYSIEESLVHVRLLSDLLLDALAHEVEAAGAAGDGEDVGVAGAGANGASGSGALDASIGVRSAHRLCGALDAVKLVFVAAYRDEEETRFTDFGATMAHEIRGHLSSALAGADLLDVLDPGGDVDKRRRAVEGIRRSLQQANQVVTSVHALSRAAVDRDATWSYQPLDVLVDEVLADRPGGGDVRVEPGDTIPSVQVPGEPLQLILHNLIDNAVKYANPDAARRWVRIHAERDPGDGHLVVHVGDNGLGIPEAEQERIFLRFRRGKESRGDGFGLGLAIVRETARRFGGRILLESEPGEGSTFSVTIPAEHIRE